MDKFFKALAPLIAGSIGLSANIACAEDVAVPVQPFTEVCRPLNASAIINGRTAMPAIQYCGYISTFPDGRKDIAYLRLSGQRLGDNRPVWPSPDLENYTDKIIAIWQKSFSNFFPDGPSLCAKSLDETNQKFIENCAIILIVSGNYDTAENFLSRLANPARGDTYYRAKIISGIKRALLDNSNWPAKRASLRAMMRVNKQAGAPFLSIDNGLSY